ncbi:MAG: TlpA family protein disulfide reductase [Bryobacteraceae bacterium]|nr:TlpA family protein disulfide reductase [Bryobacteraceae bacterium]MDW8376741.1 TlpA disulfide reductase family protein [Bryobacterales bacterium]
MKIEAILKILIVVATGALIWVASGTMYERVVGVGDSAPQFRVVTDSGQTVSRSDFGGKLLVLNFWATWCPPCIQELPSLDSFARQMKSKGVIVLGVSVDRNEQIYRQFLERAKISFLTARDPEAGISASYGTFKYPETYVISADGKVLEKFIGPENWTDPKIIERIERLL